MKKITFLLAFLLCVLFPNHSNSQTGTIDFNTTDNTDLGFKTSDGQGGSLDIPGVIFSFFISNTSGVATGEKIFYDNAGGGYEGLSASGEPGANGFKGMVLKTDDGSEFYFNGFTAAEYGYTAINLKVEGFKDGSSTGSIILGLPSIQIAPYSSDNFSEAIFGNVDEVRFTNNVEGQNVWVAFDKFVIAPSDITAPTVTSVSVPSNATYIANQNLDFTVNFNENINVVTTGGTPQLSVTVGTTVRKANYVSGSGTGALIFRYTIQNGDNDNDGTSVGTLALNGGTLKDTAGNDANLILNSVGTTSGVLVETPINNALNFDGLDDQVNLGSNLNSTLDNLNTFTVEAIVRPETTTGLGVIVGNYQTGSGGMQFLLRRDNGNYTFWIDGGSGFFHVVTAPVAVSVNTWTHIAGVWDGSEMRIYINGVLSSTATGINGANFVTNTNPIKIGLNHINENFDGDIDEIRIWSDARTVTEINAFKSKELNGGEDNLLGYYNFNDGTANGTNTGETTLIDLSTNNNNGTLSSLGLSGTSSNWVVGTPIETIPVSQSVSVPSNATYTTTQNLDFTVNYSEPVTVTTSGGTPQIALQIGSNTRQATYISGSGSSNLLYRYTVVASDLDIDGITIGTLSVNGGTLKDANGNDINLKLNTIASTSNILVGIPTFTWTGSTSNDWNTASNWDLNAVPTTNANVTIPNGITNYPTVSSSVTVNSINMASGTSLVLTSTSDIINASVTYTRNLPTTNWYLLGAPVKDERTEDLITNHTFATGTGGNIGIGTFQNNGTTPWTYFNATSNEFIIPGKGYSIKLASSGDLSITGTLVTSNLVTQMTTGSRNNFNLLGNPYPAYINSATLAGHANNSGINNDTFWFWDGTKYVTHNNANPIEIAPTQGFFVEANQKAFVYFYRENQSHKNTDTFMRSAPKTSFELFVDNGDSKRSTSVFYIDGKTTGFDYGYDSKIFGGEVSNFSVFTEQIEANNGEKLAIQTLPKDNFETMVVPIGVIAEANKEIIFSVNVSNFPTDLKIFIEDKEANTFTRLDEVNTDFKVTPTEDLNGIGRFYLHTANSVLTIDKNKTFNNISVYKLNKSTLRVSGLSEEKTAISIFNILGKKVFTTSFIANGVRDVVLPSLSRGIYLVQLKNNSGKLNKKIILE